MAQSARGGLNFGRAKPADPSARARARAILKNAPPVFSRGKVSNKNVKICCSCVPNGQIWVGSFFTFLEIQDFLKMCSGLGEDWRRTVDNSLGRGLRRIEDALKTH